MLHYGRRIPGIAAASDWARANPGYAGAIGGAAAGWTGSSAIDSYENYRRREALRQQPFMNRLGLAFQMMANPEGAIQSMHL